MTGGDRWDFFLVGGIFFGWWDFFSQAKVGGIFFFGRRDFLW